MKEKLAIFDIDKTIIKSDSMFDLLFFTLKRYPKSALGLLRLMFKLVLYKLSLIDTKIAKEEMFYVMKYLTTEDLQLFFETILKNKIYNSAINEIKKKKAEGYKVLLVSASPECYIKYFESIEEIDYVMGTVFHFSEGKYINKIIGENCKGQEKVNRINIWLEKNNITIDRELSYVYSDSYSDEPMFSLVDNKCIINNGKKKDKYLHIKWRE